MGCNMKCPDCGKKMIHKDNTITIGHLQYRETYDYCPNCKKVLNAMTR